ncbi:hypothetical protein H6P81_004543 [Aristolochia fimbriata]|uniref:mannan endo-1,4-beta-mannosidase n=1 Tax=Aristolochia fimbriata TaxID=158543 RepID=A0AAV7FFN2_ARIFI|nr:hypothetical protein H6P81_004543 [Aristolochia fimbriata]
MQRSRKGGLFFLSTSNVASVIFWCLLLVKFVAADDDGSSSSSFAKTEGTHFVLNGKPFNFVGFNAYWFIYSASDPSSAAQVTTAFQQASKYGMKVARTWAFKDGGPGALQVKPGSYNEQVFKGLDFVIAEAKKYGVYLILSLVNNYPDLGGRRQYVEWAKEEGQTTLASDDDFYTNTLIKGFYKNHVKTILNRVNTLTGVAYKEDPTIFSWELMNEPHCESDLSGTTFQNWAKEMATHVKSIDRNHMLEIGLEGFYGPSSKQLNPNGYIFGTDFITNNQIPDIDFTTIHVYADQWLHDLSDEEQVSFSKEWVNSHIHCLSGAVDDRQHQGPSPPPLKKPLVLAEFGKSSRLDKWYSPTKRDALFEALYDILDASASKGGPFVGALFWQLLLDSPGMDGLRDGYEVVLAQSPSTANIIAHQSTKLSNYQAHLQPSL